MKKTFQFVSELFKTLALALLIVVPVRYFLFQPFVVSGNSMHPNFTGGDYLFVDEISYRLREPKRGEVVVFRAPPNPSTRYIKRIIGLPGETIKIREGEVEIIGEEVLDESDYLTSENYTFSHDIQLRDDEYFVLGDNRPFSADSRNWGPLPEENLVGRSIFRAWPISRASVITRPKYE